MPDVNLNVDVTTREMHAQFRWNVLIAHAIRPSQVTGGKVFSDDNSKLIDNTMRELQAQFPKKINLSDIFTGYSLAFQSVGEYRFSLDPPLHLSEMGGTKVNYGLLRSPVILEFSRVTRKSALKGLCKWVNKISTAIDSPELQNLEVDQSSVEMIESRLMHLMSKLIDHTGVAFEVRIDKSLSFARIRLMNGSDLQINLETYLLGVIRNQPGTMEEP